MLDRLDGLRHDTVIRGHDEHDDIRHLGTPCAHRSERGMTRRIQKAQRALVRLDVVSTDVLRDAARFSVCHLGAANKIEQRRLAVIHMSHDRNHGRTWYRLPVVGGFLNQLILDRVLFEHHRLVAELFDNDGGGILVDDLVYGNHGSEIHHCLDEL